MTPASPSPAHRPARSGTVSSGGPAEASRLADATGSARTERPGRAVAEAVQTVRATGPLVHAMTNSVVREITANVLLAVGAAPAMVDHPEEAGVFAGVADGVLVNVGNPSAENFRAYRAGIATAREQGVPWVLDPVAVGGLAPRTEFAREVLDQRPAAIRGNASEIVALAGLGSGGRGVDATDSVESALDAARALAERTGGVVAVSGPEDLIVSTDRITRLHSGDALMPLVIGTGCSLGAVVAAYLGALAQDPHGATAHDAVLAAHAHLGAAGTLAGQRSRGPGSFHVHWLDAMYELDGDGVANLVGIQEQETEPAGQTEGGIA